MPNLCRSTGATAVDDVLGKRAAAQSPNLTFAAEAPWDAARRRSSCMSDPRASIHRDWL
jgi:hypothetical protein